jgi:hypothetical protein
LLKEGKDYGEGDEEDVSSHLIKIKRRGDSGTEKSHSLENWPMFLFHKHDEISNDLQSTCLKFGKVFVNFSLMFLLKFGNNWCRRMEF